MLGAMTLAVCVVCDCVVVARVLAGLLVLSDWVRLLVVAGGWMWPC